MLRRRWGLGSGLGRRGFGSAEGGLGLLLGFERGRMGEGWVGDGKVWRGLGMEFGGTYM